MALEYSWLAPIALFVLVVLVFVAWEISKKRRRQAIIENLDKDGEKAVSILHRAGGRMKQKTLQKRMGLSGPRFNKLLRAMEELEAIRRIPGTRENTVILLV